MPVRGVHHVQLSDQIQTRSVSSALITTGLVQSGRGAAVLPQQQVDEHRDGEEGASHGGVAAQEEEEVAEEAEEHHPDHVELEEQVEGVKASDHGAKVLDQRWKTWKRRRSRPSLSAQSTASYMRQHLRCNVVFLKETKRV